MKFFFFLFTLFLGMLIGITGLIKTPDRVLPYVPKVIKGEPKTLEGSVMKKEFKEKALLVTINTDKGALVATFTKKIEETDLLIDKNDSVTVILDHYKPFMKNPKIAQVQKVRPKQNKPQKAAVKVPVKPQVTAPVPVQPQKDRAGTVVEEKKEDLVVDPKN